MSPDRTPPGPRRRQCLKALPALAAAALPLPTVAQVGDAPDAAHSSTRLDPAMFLRLQALVRPALEQMRRRQWMAAAHLLGRARAVVDAEPDALWAWRCYVLPPYGAVLLELGQLALALEVLLQAREAEQRLDRGEGDPRMRKVFQGQAGGFSRMLLQTEFKRQLFEPVAVAGRQRARTLMTMLFDGGVGAHASLLPLARAHAQAGDTAALAALYRGLPPSAPGDIDPAWRASVVLSEGTLLAPAPPVGEEYTRFTFGVLLAARALDEALALNWLRLRWQGSWVPSIAAHAAAFGIRRMQLAAALSVAWQTPSAPAPTPQRARHLVARIVESKGLGVRHAERLRLLLARASSPEVSAARQELQRLEDQLAQALAPGRPGDGVPQRPRPGAAEAAAAAAEHHAALVLLNASLGESLALEAALPALRQAGLDAVFVPGERLIADAQAARPEAAFIGFFAHARLAADGRSFGARRYARYTLAGDELSLVDLGDQQHIDALLARWRAAAMARRDGALATSGHALREALLSGLPPGVLARQRWIVDPDGALALLPFEALPGHAAPALLDERCISQVTSLASLSGGAAPAVAQGEARVIADPAYPAKGASSADDAAAGQPAPRSLAPLPLPETRREAEAVAAAWARMGVPVRRYVGPQAGRDALPFAGPAPRYLHVAAHGLLLQPLDDENELRAPVEILLPGRGAALALAQGGQLQLVTASELQRLQLHGTELVVLSACDTGNGEASAGEGVDSLRRAVEVAGARASLSAVWPVPSQATVALMETFYRRLADGERPAQALRAAKLALRARQASPLDWAGFVLAGQG